MRTEKLTFRSMKNALSKNEMKKIMAGSNALNKCCANPQTSNQYNGCSSCAQGTYCVTGAYLVAC